MFPSWNSLHNLPKRYFALLLIASSFSICNAQMDTQSTLPSLIPVPFSMTAAPGSLVIKNGAVIEVMKGDKDSLATANYLAELVQRTRGLKLVVQAGPQAKGSAIVFRKTSNGSADTAKESYDLTVSSKRVEVSAGTGSGLFYGAVTLWELLTQTSARSGPATLQGVVIHDEPRLVWRGLMLDSARHMQSPEFIKQLIDWMALQKLNVLHWHLTDDQGWRLEIKRYPRLTEVGAWRVLASERGKIDPKTGKPPIYGGFYTQAEVRDIVAYAAARHITIVPEIEMPGHATAAIAAYPELGSAADTPRTPTSRYGIFPNLYNVNDNAFTFLENVLTEVMELFPSAYIHVGGDEAIKDQWKASPVIQAQMREKGIKTEDELQSYFIKRIDKFLTAHHRRTIGWDEILEGGLPPAATVMSWRGLNGGIAAAQSGHDAVLTPARPLYFNYRQGDGPNEGTGRWALNTLKDVYQFNPAPASLTEDERKHIIGVQGNLWTEYVINRGRVEPMLFPRSAALAEMAWSPAQKLDWPGFLHRMDAELNRYRDVGIHFAPTAFEVRTTEQLNAAQNTVQIALANQTGFGQIHYTVDGSAVTNDSPTYTAPFVVPLPTLLRAGTFEGGKLLTAAIARPLNALSVRRRDSRELQLCSNDPAIQMEPDPPPPTNSPVFLVNYKKSCWIYKGADLTGISSISASVLHIPYVFQDSSTSKPPELPTPHSPNGELEVHLDSCTGEPIAVLPLPSPSKSDGLTTLTTKIAQQNGKHDLCMFFTRKQPDPLWVLQWIQLTPANRQ